MNTNESKKRDWEREKGGEGIRALSRTQLILSGARSGRSMWDCTGHVLHRDDDVMLPVDTKITAYTLCT